MLDDKKMVKVTNRTRGSLGYTVEDLNNLHRRYSSGETKTVTVEELRKLSWKPGGMYMLQNSLLIHDAEVVKELLNIDVEPEYYYSEKEVVELLTKGSLDQLLDCLDFAPQGVIDLIKKNAVTLKINDISKRKAILEKTGFDVTKAVEINEEADKLDEDAAAPAGRRVSLPTSNVEATPTRRATVGKYTPISNNSNK